MIKNVTLALTRIKDHFTGNKLIFTLFIIGVFISSVSFIYFYGNISNGQNSMKSNDEELRTYDIQFKASLDIKNENIQKLLKDNKFILHSNQSVSVPEEFIKEFYKDNGNNIEHDIKTYKNDDFYAYSIYGESGFKEGETNGILISEQMWMDFDKIKQSDNKAIEINGRQYDIAGIVVNSETMVIIPYDTFISSGFDISGISVTLPKILTTNQDRIFVESISNDFEGASVVSPHIKHSEYIQEEYETRKNHVISISIMFVISFISFMFLIKYLIDNTAYEDSIYSLLGADKSRIALIIFLEIFIIVIAEILLAVSFHVLFKDIIFSKINIYDYIEYSISDYCFSGLLISSMSIICIIPFLISFANKSSVAIKNKFQK